MGQEYFRFQLYENEEQENAAISGRNKLSIIKDILNEEPLNTSFS